jgi:RNA polymerase sigma-70 factor, ECF subfamily
VCTDAPAGSGIGVASQAAPAWFVEFWVSWRTSLGPWAALPSSWKAVTLGKSQKLSVTAPAGAASPLSESAARDDAARRAVERRKGPRVYRLAACVRKALRAIIVPTIPDGGRAPLSELFAATVTRHGGPEVVPSLALEAALAEVCAATQRALPAVAVEPAALFAALARAGVASSPDVVRAVAEARAAELHLAGACAAGEPAAIALVRERFGPDVESALRRTGVDTTSRDDLLQQMWEKLFVGPQPRILDYAGKGELRGWLRATAVRQALNHLTRGQREQPVEDELFAALPAGDLDPETAHLKALYSAELKEAFGEAVRALTAQERNLLRYASVEGLSIDAVAALHGVHRATAARWIQAARERLITAVRARLVARLWIPPRDVDSILRLVQSGVSITLERHLAPAATTKGSSGG